MHSEAERRHNDDDNNNHHDDHDHSHYKPHYDYSRQPQHDAKKVVRYIPLTAKAYSQLIEKGSHKKDGISTFLHLISFLSSAFK
jgi:hypothetical protein